ncbi:hypothetical protein KDX30_01135 [Pseudomonas sp. CDFA 553]|uniref:hypothetical protein n=1 Tax=Pseudomonas quasicaspiana TaxID=2829821 RepID=UPI001E633044|nr:hypothetical protein [Pseudomonas quasicaspiana]MCD5986494.1 hypothetical protein [Pseudomonas quasicaspiana]
MKNSIFSIVAAVVLGLAYYVFYLPTGTALAVGGVSAISSLKTCVDIRARMPDSLERAKVFLNETSGVHVADVNAVGTNQDDAPAPITLVDGVGSDLNLSSELRKCTSQLKREVERRT